MLMKDLIVMIINNKTCMFSRQIIIMITNNRMQQAIKTKFHSKTLADHLHQLDILILINNNRMGNNKVKVITNNNLTIKYRMILILCIKIMIISRTTGSKVNII